MSVPILPSGVPRIDAETQLTVNNWCHSRTRKFERRFLFLRSAFGAVHGPRHPDVVRIVDSLRKDGAGFREITAGTGAYYTGRIRRRSGSMVWCGSWWRACEGGRRGRLVRWTCSRWGGSAGQRHRATWRVDAEDRDSTAATAPAAAASTTSMS